MMVGGGYTASTRFRSALIGTAVVAAYDRGGEKSSVAACESISRRPRRRLNRRECPSLGVGRYAGCNLLVAAAPQTANGSGALPVVAASARNRRLQPMFLRRDIRPIGIRSLRSVPVSTTTISANSRINSCRFS